MNDTSFGNFECAKILVEELRKAPEYQKKVTRLIRNYTTCLHNLSLVPDKKFRYYIARLLRKEYLDHANFSTNINNFYKNTIIAYYRKFTT